MFRIVCAAVALLWATSSVEGQSADAYLQAAKRYRENPRQAVVTISQMERRDITDGIRECLTTRCGPRELMAHAMLHADIVESVLAADPDRARFHAQSGVRLLDPLRNDAAQVMSNRPGVDRMFVPRWYAFVARLYLAQHYVAEARTTIADGLRKGGESPDLYVARGLATELPLLWDYPDLRGTIANRAHIFANANQHPEDALLKLLESAALDYRRALSLQPSHVVARLRLGWTHLVTQDPRASEDLSTAIRDAVDPELLYLAHLLRGAVDEQARTPADAVSDYEAAERLQPGAQTACVALSHAYDEANQRAKAQQLVERCLSRAGDAPGPDPWWLFRFGLTDTTTTQWLHDVARRP